MLVACRLRERGVNRAIRSLSPGNPVCTSRVRVNRAAASEGSRPISPPPAVEPEVSTFEKEFYKKTPNHDTRHGTGAHWH